jgi:preprotein translocase subunit SecF
MVRERRKKGMEIDFVSKAKLWIIIPLVIIIAGLGVIIFQGLNLGVDFVGGSLIYVNIGKPYKADDIRSIFTSEGVNATVVQVGENKQDAIIRMKHMENQEDIQQGITSALKEKYGLTDEQFSVETVGATVGRELTQNALKSTVIAWALILVYIWIRFELKSGLAAIVALVHDVLIMISVAALLRTQINSSFIAAILTIVGYSINDTIVIFDRIRENDKRFGRKLSKAEIVNTSINENISRSINTSFTTLITVTAIYVLGVQSIKEFALPLLVGIICGTYSSIFIAGPLWALWNEDSSNKKLATAK